MSSLSCVVMGNESLLIQCAERLLQGGDRISAVITRHADIRTWALHHGLRVESPGEGLADRLAAQEKRHARRCETQSGAARTDYQDVVLVGVELGHQRSLRSVQMPMAQRRT